MPEILYIIIGGAAMILSMKFAIDGLKKFSLFLKIIHDPDKPKHSKKSMWLSLIIYLLILFILGLLTSILSFFIVLVWIPVLLITWYYIKLWKYQGYSVLLLIGAFCADIVAVILLSPFLKSLLVMLLQKFGIYY